MKNLIACCGRFCVAEEPGRDGLTLRHRPYDFAKTGELRHCLVLGAEHSSAWNRVDHPPSCTSRIEPKRIRDVLGVAQPGCVGTDHGFWLRPDHRSVYQLCGSRSAEP